jgi:hypothetical protein
MAALLGTIGIAYIASYVICAMKGKAWFVITGIVCLPFARISFWPVIGAIRLAKPNSAWARLYYNEDKMEIVRKRYQYRGSLGVKGLE